MNFKKSVLYITSFNAVSNVVFSGPVLSSSAFTLA